MTGRGKTEPIVFQDGVITALVERHVRAERVAVHLDGRRAFDLASAVADRAGLRVGDALTAEQQQQLVDQDAPHRARERALRLLGLRDRSRREVEMRLRQAGFAPAIIEETVDWLAGLNYIDDRRFAAAYAAEKGRSGWGPRRVRMELAAKGVERSVADETVSALEAAGSAASAEGDAALERAVRKRFSGQFAADPQAAERRLAGFLARRGYDWDTIGCMVRKLRAEASSEAESPSIP